MGHLLDDYKEVSFTITETSYWIGAGTGSGTKFRAESIKFQATEDCYIRFNASDAVQHFISKEDYHTFDRKTVIIFVVRDTTDGTLRIWAEGDIKT